MALIGIVCEYNPFHNGHKYLIDSVKCEGDTVLAVMSGNFVQRAEPAIFPKEIRVQAALECGVDIVIELPFIYAVSSAEIFARSAVNILISAGCDKIAFGAESDDINLLQTAADLLLSSDLDRKTAEYLQFGMSYPAARQRAFDGYGVKCDISSPNNILALEYLKAIKKSGEKITPIAVKRIGAGYNNICTDGDFPSAAGIRKCISSGIPINEFVPSAAAEFYLNALNNGNCVSYEKYNLAALTILRQKNINELSDTAHMAEGLENRIFSAVKTSTDLNQLYDTVKTKRFTHSRIRRAVLSACFGITEEDLKINVPYIRLLGFNKKAERQLGTIAKGSRIPFTVNYRDIEALSDEDVQRVFQLQNASSDFFNLILKNPRQCSSEITFTPLKV